MLVIRLRRIGKKNKPSYRVVVAEHTWAAAGKFTADLGFYNPHSKEFKVDKDAVMEWLKKGAKPSNSLSRLLQSLKLKHASIVVVKRNKKAKKDAEPKADVAVKAEVTPVEGEKPEVGAEVATEKDAVEEAETEVKEAVAEPAAEPTEEKTEA